MIKQAIDQPRKPLQPKQADKDSKLEKGSARDAEQGFAAELSAAALLAPQAAVPQATAPAGKGTEGAIGKGTAKEAMPEAGAAKALAGQPSALNLKAATGNARDSVVTGPAIAGLKQPMNLARTGEMSRWVFGGEKPELDFAAQAPASDSGALNPGKADALKAPAQRGEADAALASKLEWLSDGLPAQAQPRATDAGAGTPGLSDQAAPQAQPGGGQLSAPAAHDAGLEAHVGAMLASMGGGVHGFNPGKSQGTIDGKARVQGAFAQQAGGLSGGEFLSALGAAKGGASRFEASNQQFEGGEGKNAGTGAKAPLRVIPGAKSVKQEFESDLTASRALGNLAGAHGPMAAVNGGVSGGAGLAPEVAGHVVKGAGSQERLSSESLGNLTNTLRGFSAQGGGGEMRIRLKPENLGELHVRVMTDGSNVGLQIQASDEKARKILEESLVHLKDSLATQSLSLGTVDLTVAQSQGSSSFGDNLNQQGGNQAAQNAFGDVLGNQAGHRQSREQGSGAWNGDNAGSARRPGFTAAPAAPARAFAQSGVGASGRLDVRA